MWVICGEFGVREGALMKGNMIGCVDSMSDGVKVVVGILRWGITNNQTWLRLGFKFVCGIRT